MFTVMVVTAVLLSAAGDDVQTITAIALGTAIAGVLSPFITALLNQPKFTSQQKTMIATGVAFILGIAATWITGGFTLGTASSAAQVLAVVGVSQTLYALILKPTGLGDALTALTTLPALNEKAAEVTLAEAEEVEATPPPTKRPAAKRSTK